MKVVLDSSFLLEMLLRRECAAQCAEMISNPRYILSISIVTAHLCFHFGQKEGLKIGEIADYITDFEVLKSGAEDIDLALLLVKGKDFEDALQVAIAENNSCDLMLTRDKKFQNRYSAFIPIKRI